MKKQIIFIMALCCMLLLSACGVIYPNSGEKKQEQEKESSNTQKEEKKAYQQINAKEAKKMMEDREVIIVDVRTEDEYKEEHIPNAELVPVESIGEEMPVALPDLDVVLLVYCRSGNRSKIASDKLAQIGYTNVYEFGGIMDWPYETVKGEG